MFFVTYLIIILGLLYLFFKWKFSYWKTRNVYYVEPSFLYGNIGDVITGKKDISHVVGKLYNEAKSKGLKYFGMFRIWEPVLVVFDLELIKRIVQTDFNHFISHGVTPNEKADPLSTHLFNLETEKWKKLRMKLTPAFTSGKMKMMFQTMVAATEGLREILKEESSLKTPKEIKDILSRYTTDIIGSVVYGVEVDSMKNPNSEFRKYSDRFFMGNLKRIINDFCSSYLPKWLFSHFGQILNDREFTRFFIDMVKNTMEYREKHKIVRKDFMHLLIQLKNTGRVENFDEASLITKQNTANDMSIEDIAAQAFVFFLAGFETSATTMTFAILELSQNQELQEKLRKEIQDVIKKYNNEITYEGIMEMEYLEMVISETLRKHPPVTVLPRGCVADYKVPDSDLIITAGTKVDIPVTSIHMDPEYYPNPEKFDPERFSKENKEKILNYTYMPFGEGPRACIGLRFGKLQAKVGMCTLLKDYKTTLNEKTKLPIQYDPKSLVASVKGGVWINLEKI